jgi:TetR/AcrR family transcriptional regulator, mexJK operon transcriptional repressor
MQRRARAIREAASRVFLARGYDNATMEQVAEEAGVTKKTLYNHFRDKDALFEASIAALCDALLADLPTAADRLDDESGTLERNLEHFCQTFLEVLTGPTGMELFRLAVSVAPRFPALGQAVYRAGPERINAALAGYLEREAAAQRLTILDPEEAAQQLVGMISGQAQLRMLGATRPAPAEVQAYVHSAVQAFCRAHAPNKRRRARRVQT